MSLDKAYTEKIWEVKVRARERLEDKMWEVARWEDELEEQEGATRGRGGIIRSGRGKGGMMGRGKIRRTA